MKEYEITATFLNGCAGSAHPMTQFEEAELESPESYIRAKYGKDFDRFVKDARSDGQTIFTFDNGTVTYIYEFSEL